MEEIKQISIENPSYPHLLKKIKNPPKILYHGGSFFPEERCFAVIGTRRCSSYGKQIALEIAGDLSEAGMTIVSGLAPGIDTFAHLAAVGKKARTIAVLGTGVDEESIYPKSNIKLTERILENNGCLVSEYPPGTHGSKFSFVQRNRIISGLSLGVLVIEAKEKSGALITASFALSQKRPVFAIPGSIYSLNSKGCHYLIKKGARLVENAGDILKEFGFSRFIPKKKTEEANGEEQLILEILKQGPLEVDRIIKRTGFPASKTAGLLAILEIKGKVRNLEGNTFGLCT